jgi:hypothetical protein
LRGQTRLYGLSFLCYVVAFGLAFVSVILSLGICMGLALLYALPERGSAQTEVSGG